MHATPMKITHNIFTSIKIDSKSSRHGMIYGMTTHEWTCANDYIFIIR